MKSITKRILPILMAMLMLAGFPLAATADASPQSESISVFIRVERDDGTYLPRYEVQDMSYGTTLEEYGVQGTPTENGYISPVHVLCQAMTETGLEDEIEQIEISGSWVVDMFGMGMDVMYYVNGVDHPVGFTDYEVEDGDEIVIIECKYGDMGYTALGFFGELEEDETNPWNPFKASEFPLTTTIAYGDTLDLTYCYTGWSTGSDVAAYAPIYISTDGGDRATIRTSYTTDANGFVSMPLPQGTYIVSARAFANPEETARLASNAYCKVTVS